MKYSICALLLFSNLLLNAQISQDGLLAYYPFDGNVQDMSANNYDGQSYGGTFGLDENGNVNSSLTLNGIDEFVDLSNFAVDFRDNLGVMSIYFKVKFDEEDESQTILSLGTQGENLLTNVFEVEYENGGFQIETETGNGAVNSELEVDQKEALLDGEWHEILIVINGDSLTYCRDGIAVYEGLYAPTETLTSNFFVGCYNGTGGNACCFFGGSIDELQFYNRTLDKDELLVSIQEPAADNQMLIFPNPVSENPTIRLNKPVEELSIRIYAIDGRLLNIQQEKNALEFSLELPDAKGMYSVELFDGEKRIATERVTKQ